MLFGFRAYGERIGFTLTTILSARLTNFLPETMLRSSGTVMISGKKFIDILLQFSLSTGQTGNKRRKTIAIPVIFDFVFYCDAVKEKQKKKNPNFFTVRLRWPFIDAVRISKYPGVYFFFRLFIAILIFEVFFFYFSFYFVLSRYDFFFCFFLASIVRLFVTK